MQKATKSHTARHQILAQNMLTEGGGADILVCEHTKQKFADRVARVFFPIVLKFNMWNFNLFVLEIIFLMQ